MKIRLLAAALPLAFAAMSAPIAHADENLFGYVKGSETLPEDASEAYVWLTHRFDKGQGEYSAYDSKLEYEYGVTSRFTAAAALMGQSIDTSGLVINGYLPGAESYGFKLSGIELKGKYNFLSAAMDPVGLSQLVAVANAGLEGTYAKRDPLDAATQASADSAMQALTGDPGATFEWPTEPEMELEVTFGAGVSYRFAPNWSIGAETQYQTEFETEVGQERYSWFAGPTLHYGSEKWWATLTWFEQLKGGKEQYINQADGNLHLIEKTEHEVRLKLGYNF
ncbi:MAG: hypothetical protein B7Y21_06260 [Hydrogenophilales bacterium 16-61-112]|nr:MAG: hypothetical protein B7Y21_06260 [Hydrogenophilales bacterium 16-61-112]